MLEHYPFKVLVMIEIIFAYISTFWQYIKGFIGILMDDESYKPLSLDIVIVILAITIVMLIAPRESLL